MRTLNFVIFFILMHHCVLGQSISRMDIIPTDADTLIKMFFTFGAALNIPTNTGSGQVWDYSSDPVSPFTELVVFNTIGSDTINYPNGEFVVTYEFLPNIKDIYSYTNGLEYHGRTEPGVFFDAYNPPQKLVSFPIDSSTADSVIFTSVVPGNSGGYNKFDYLGDGTLILPNGIVHNNTLLIKRVQQTAVSAPTTHYEWYAVGYPLPVMSLRANRGVYYNHPYTVVKVNELPSLNLDISLFPNPTNDQIHIRTTETIQSMQLLNSIGKVIHAVPSTTTTISVDNLTSGVYILAISTAKGIAYKQFVKL